MGNDIISHSPAAMHATPPRMIVAEAPMRNSGSSGFKVNEMRTGKRCVVFTQLPVAFSEGSNEKDEPLAGLNHTEAGRLADLIAELNASGLTIVLVEHNLGEVTRVASRLLVLHNGSMLAQGVPRDVMARGDVRNAYLGGETVACA